MNHVWGLIDDRTGHTGQVLGLVSRLGLPYVLKRLDYNFLAQLPAPLVGSNLLSVSRDHARHIAPPYPTLVIAAGRRTLPVLRHIKRQSPFTKTVYLMWPEMRAGIDLIAVPEHDDAPTGANVITTLGPLHAVTAETLAAARGAWGAQFTHLPRPYIMLSLGGATSHGRYSATDWREIIQRSIKLAGHGSLLVTTSRRTPPEALAILEPLLQLPHILHRFDRDKDNPYLGFLACADAVVVTGDSLNMCAEACVSGKPVFIYASENVAPPKHRRLHEALFARGMARAFTFDASLDWTPNAALDDVEKVAREIRVRFAEIFA